MGEREEAKRAWRNGGARSRDAGTRTSENNGKRMRNGATGQDGKRGSRETVTAAKETGTSRLRLDEESYRNVIPVTRAFSVPPPSQTLLHIPRLSFLFPAFNASREKKAREPGTKLINAFADTQNSASFRSKTPSSFAITIHVPNAATL